MKKTTRRQTSAVRRALHHLGKMRRAASDVHRLWKACQWLVAEARKADRVGDVTRAVLGLVGHVRESLPLPDALHQAAVSVVQPPGVAWRVPRHARGGAPTTSPQLDERVGDADRRERVA